MIIAKAKGKNLTQVITQFWILAARADKPDIIMNHDIMANEIRASNHQAGCHPRPSANDCIA